MEQITENPYYQYFAGLPGFQNESPFVLSLLVEFRKRLNNEIMTEINEMIITYNTLDDPGPRDGGGSDLSTETEEPTNSGTIILNATCALQNISYPQDINLLNETRENLEKMIDEICYNYNYNKHRTYRENARRDYLNLAKCKKRTAKKIRKAIKRQLQYVRRDFGYVEARLFDAMELSSKQLMKYAVLNQVYEQQQYMYEDQVHTVRTGSSAPVNLTSAPLFAERLRLPWNSERSWI